MRILLCISVLAALATAFPYPQEIEDLPTPAVPLTDIFPASTTTIPDSTSLNIPVTAVPTIDPDDDDDDDKGAEMLNSTSSRRRPHTEPIPIFTKACKCDLATALYPCWATDALQRCHFEENFSYQCYMQAAGGCAYPTRIQPLSTDTQTRAQSLPVTTPSSSYHNESTSYHHRLAYFELHVAGRTNPDDYVACVANVALD
ncbi:hypothetical protein PTNB73_06843 [Pyrenophora teres f. teres]|uniref:Extracellular membrane protein CFEM domain-containing protein n=1 Tax=Pyrenophora teres f. teres (strain 0-1) TaxID=861557 RepID=E3RRP8_PYRTT|nr:hypothetical protein PTT_11513 [Pyrenophora teres f. teres 0-1]KAE8826433.1 hypothetical protein HRS9122_09935 [Pyrenophora teres f. teres]KAE8828387.1 hypothetical protein HRS9139_07606 [Pyrenophora teres f. teres]KAE8830988.1 hypothetical protein PTNB85_07575 [Pyrenophora teres f. teres]KAE8857012.1 hypothetical protein PTNB29_08079 [Pyrenophora teres f. teres]